jgi:hypothetical protein
VPYLHADGYVNPAEEIPYCKADDAWHHEIWHILYLSLVVEAQEHREDCHNAKTLHDKPEVMENELEIVSPVHE